MRTVKRESLKLNRAKWEAVERLAAEFARDKQRHLGHYQEATNFASASRRRRQVAVESRSIRHTPRKPVRVAVI